MQKYNNELNYLKKYIKETNKDTVYYNKCKQELLKGRPIQYVIGNVNFYGNEIKVNESVLIPRFETELLCEKTIKKIEKLFLNHKIDIIDLGTGSGCIAITLKKELNCNITALDISAEALIVAKQNAIHNSVDITFINEDLSTYKKEKYDVIISNPPYISKNEKIMDIVKENEPHLALYAEEEGLFFYRKIIENIPFITKDKFLVALEIGKEQSTSIVDIINNNLKDVKITVEKDYQGLDRFIFITKE